MDGSPTSLPLSRRDALRRIVSASALAAALDITAFAAEDIARIGDDPNLLAKEIPWPRLLTPEEKRLVTALGDLIIPADPYGPAASAVGIPDFIDEWVSAPYPEQRKDLEVIRPGLAWVDGESRKRFGKGFAESDLTQQTVLLEDIVKGGTPRTRPPTPSSSSSAIAWPAATFRPQKGGKPSATPATSPPRNSPAQLRKSFNISVSYNPPIHGLSANFQDPGRAL